ncbi:hypothetical protein BJY01DRAFT_78610 [Aspergillus pseudoustus]|uniref:Uncharacterized protein n=1 Tax=Aspergillus pseudoustus TaxID=1810923 RepID=A0ABR4KLV5_9EURO
MTLVLGLCIFYGLSLGTYDPSMLGVHCVHRDTRRSKDWTGAILYRISNHMSYDLCAIHHIFLVMAHHRGLQIT